MAGGGSGKKADRRRRGGGHRCCVGERKLGNILPNSRDCGKTYERWGGREELPLVKLTSKDYF